MGDSIMPHKPLNIDQVQNFIDHSILRYAVPGTVLSSPNSFDTKVNVLKGKPKEGNDYYYIYNEETPHVQTVLVRTKKGQWLEEKPFTKYVVKSQKDVHGKDEKAKAEKAVAMTKKVYGESAGGAIFWNSESKEKLVAHHIIPEISGDSLINYFDVSADDGVYHAASFLRETDRLYDLSSDKRSKVWRLRAVVAVLEALADIHAQDVVHANITLKNVIYDDKTGVAHFVGFDDAGLEGESVKISKAAASRLPPDDVDLRAAAERGEEVKLKKEWDIHSVEAVISQLLSGIDLSQEREIADYLQKMCILTSWREKKRLEEEPGFKQPTAADAAKFFGDVLEKTDKPAYDQQKVAIQKQRQLQQTNPIRDNFEKLYIAANLAEQKLAADVARLQEKIRREDAKDPKKGEKRDEVKVQKLEGKIKVFDNISTTLKTQMQKIDDAMHKPASGNLMTQDNFEKIYQDVRTPFVSEDNRKALEENHSLFLEVFNVVTRPWSWFVGAIRGVLTNNWTTFEGGFAATDSLSAYVSADRYIAAAKPGSK